MPIYQLSEELIFPDIELAEENGLLAIGGDLSVKRLVLAYESGIFPWYSDGDPILWWSPNPRFVLKTNEVHISKSMRRVFNKSDWKFKINTAFKEVIDHCGAVPRDGQDGTWITEEMKLAYIELFEKDRALSFEVWKNNQLIGGMYGVLSRNYFAGESMFSLESNASKYALIKACEYLNSKSIEILDCQIYSEHLENMGAFEMTRSNFSEYLSF